METVYCTRCDTCKAKPEFAPSALRKSGRGTCRVCMKRAQQDWYRRNKKMRVKQQRAWQRCNPEKLREYQQRAKGLYPERFAARDAVVCAIRKGVLIKPTTCCIDNERCSGRIEAHHSNYSKPLEVQWLCSTHHGAWHRYFEVS